MIDTVLFDFDGTIMDTNDIIMQSWQHTFRELQGREEDPALLLKTFGEPLEDTMLNLFPDVPLEKSIWIYRNYQRDNFLSNIHLFPGVRELLDTLLERGVKMALVTSRLRHTTGQALDHFDLHKYFGYVVTADDVTRHKPDPQSMEIALEKINSQPENALMLGDTMFDLLCARNAGAHPVLVSWSMSLAGRTMDDFAEREAPEFIITDPAQVLEIIDSMNA